MDVDSRELIAMHASRAGEMLNVLKMLRKVLEAHNEKPVIVVSMGTREARDGILSQDGWQ